MEQKKIAIIHSRDSSLVTLLARLTQELGHDPSTMVVNKDTPPQDVASFVQGISPLSLVLLAENYISYNDPFVQAYLRQNEYKVTSEGIEGIKGGEGIEALVEIKKSHPNLPVFMVSGDPQHMEEAMMKGANGYLVLPIDLEQYGAFLTQAFESGPRI